MLSCGVNAPTVESRIPAACEAHGPGHPWEERTRVVIDLIYVLPRPRTCPTMGQKRTSRHVRVMSVIPLKADIRQPEWHVRHVPEAEIRSSALQSK